MNFLEFKDEKQTFSKVLKTKIVILPFFLKENTKLQGLG